MKSFNYDLDQEVNYDPKVELNITEDNRFLVKTEEPTSVFPELGDITSSIFRPLLFGLVIFGMLLWMLVVCYPLMVSYCQRSLRCIRTIQIRLILQRLFDTICHRTHTC